MPEDMLSLSMRERAARYRARAEQAITSARRVTDHRVRAQFVLIAQGWNNLADLTERSLLEPPPNRSRTSKREASATPAFLDFPFPAQGERR
jgi:hypothetical protein